MKHSLGEHGGSSLANNFMNILRQYDLEQKPTCITTENASVNNCMEMEIAIMRPTFQPETHAIGCMAHILHLEAWDGLNALSINNAPSIDSENEINKNCMAISNITDPPDGLNLDYNSIISQISQLASYLWDSPHR
ncbi:hypothetical protein O181_048725 [Austropuccinia psidii MF-1]|uniref:Uncharacterized protein n=1 Tax=Austropuccinia psidii MF-1 TaxID=1389203 RepID=A0A9Q3DSE8_9BASI|nr:hypothetical protein [Austropuccinia psidii MF-1]